MNVEYDSLINEDYDNDSSGKIWIEYYKPFYSISENHKKRIEPYIPIAEFYNIKPFNFYIHFLSFIFNLF